MSYFKCEEAPCRDGGVRFRLIMGELAGRTSPVKTFSRTLYADLSFDAGGQADLDVTESETAIYVADGELQIDNAPVPAGVMVVLGGEGTVPVHASTATRALLIGGDPLGERHLFWNFVSDSAKRIERAKQDWRDGGFAPVPDDDEYIPLPGEE